MSHSQDSISVERVLRVLSRRWWLVAQLVIAGAAIGAVLALSAAEEYEATATVLITGAESGEAQEPLPADAAARLVRTRSVAELVADDLPGDPSADELLGDVSTSVDPSATFVDVTARRESATEATAVANAFARQFVASPDNDAAALRGIDAEVVDPAVDAGEVDAGRLPLWTAIGAGLGLLLGLIGAFSLAALDPRVRALDELRTLTTAPQLAAIPALSRRPRRQPSVLRSPREPFELLRGTLLLLSGDRPLRRIIVSSPYDRNDGKSAVAANLAVSLARVGLRTCAVDADLRKPSLPACFGLEDTGVGLADAIRGESPARARAIQRFAVPGSGDGDGREPEAAAEVSVVAAGAAKGDAAELLASPRTDAVLDSLEADHDVVVIDCAPVLALGDALSLLEGASGTVLVVRHSHTQRRSVTRAAEVVEAHGALLGIVATDVPRRELATEGYGPWLGPPLRAHDA